SCPLTRSSLSPDCRVRRHVSPSAAIEEPVTAFVTWAFDLCVSAHFQRCILPAMSYMLSHLTNGWQVDQAILSEEDRVVVIRFGHDWDPSCMVMDETLFKIAEKVKNFAVIYLVDITKVPDFNKMYELYDPCTVMFFYRNKHIMIDLGTGNNNKINWPIEDGQEMLDIIETVFRGARKGRGLVVSPKDYSTKYRWGYPESTRTVIMSPLCKRTQDVATDGELYNRKSRIVAAGVPPYKAEGSHTKPTSQSDVDIALKERAGAVLLD
ncbi:mitosis protein DIM1, partial [Opisthorchis viverrini]